MYRRVEARAKTVSMKALIDYLEKLKLAGGDHDGQSFTVLPWEKRFIKGAFSGPGDSALSVGRGNGKSAFCSAIATSVVDPAGPLTGNRREVLCVASSFSQARIIFEDTIFFLRGAGHDLGNRRLWRLQDSVNSATVEYRPTGARCRAIGGEPKRAHGLRPALALLDEPAQWDSAKSERMLSAVRTGLGKTPGSRLIALGTRPANSQHWFARMLDGGAAYSQIHAAGPNDPPFQFRTWLKANPSLKHLPSLLAEIRSEAADARKDPSTLAAFSALRLNLGTSDVRESVILDASTWARIEGPGVRLGQYVLGVDLGGAAAMTAVAGYWPASGLLLSLAAFPSVPDLVERGLRDGCERLYCDMAKRGELLVLGRHVVDLEALLGGAVLDKWGAPGAIVCDRWREDLLREALEKMKFPPCDLVVRGQGFKDGGEDLDLFRRACLSGKVCPKPSLLLRSAMREARSVADPAGNEKLCKATEGGRRLRARDDAVAAAILAVAEGTRRGSDKPSSGVYLGLVA